MSTVVHRLFFALWPREPLRAQLRAAAAPVLERVGARAVAPEEWHLTLAFLGAVADAQLPALMEQAAQLRPARFALQLNGFEYWPGPQALCAVAGPPGPAVLALVAALRRIGAAAGATGEAVPPFRPHVTLARRVRPPAEAVAPEWPPLALEFEVHDFTLVASLDREQRRLRAADACEADGRYHRLAMWPLG